MKCYYCGDTEEESNLTYCHNCDKTICVDNCIGSQDDEHGLDFCIPCTEKLGVEESNNERNEDEF